MNNFPIWVLLADIRSCGNVGAILRTADACGIDQVIACGYTPYPLIDSDTRPPHIADSNTRAIHKTALGAELNINISTNNSLSAAIFQARHAGMQIIALEQSPRSLPLQSYHPTGPIALILGNEVNGLDQNALDEADVILELPMVGHKESYGVTVAGGIALHHLRFG